MFTRFIRLILITLAVLSLSTACARDSGAGPWQEEFDISECNMLSEGRSRYFVMEPGFQLVLEDDDTKLQVTVLDETKTVDGVVTRVVEEREWVDGALYEISRNYFAMCESTKDVFYFGEDVDFYKGGKVVKHDGSWLAGTDGSRAGLIMAGTPTLKMMYYQEIAPGVAMDRAEIVSLDETCKTPAGTFSKCMKVKEGTALNINEAEYKYYAPDIGLIRDENLRLIKYGSVKN
ncbi:MAG: hypothetical protein IMF05_01385 [Proteobacteria bacterium]|nr:hypothetical protein [Pseudomonadota bacterium]